MIVGLGASFLIFGAVRMFAKPAPYTMTKEYQEATNEMLIVRSPAAFLKNLLTSPEPKSRPHHRYQLAWVHRQGRRPVAPRQRLERGGREAGHGITIETSSFLCHRGTSRPAGGVAIGRVTTRSVDVAVNTVSTTMNHGLWPLFLDVSGDPTGPLFCVSPDFDCLQTVGLCS